MSFTHLSTAAYNGSHAQVFVFSSSQEGAQIKISKLYVCLIF